MSTTLLSFYFLAGLLAVVFFFLSAVLIGLSLFASPSGKKKLLHAESVALFLVLASLAYLSWNLWGELQQLRSPIEPGLLQLGDWGRQVASVLLLGLAVVFASLVGCFGWVRAGFAGNGMRTLVLALLGLRVVLASVSLLELLSRASRQGDGKIPDGDLAAEATPVLKALEASMALWLPLCLGFFVLTMMASFVMRRK